MPESNTNRGRPFRGEPRLFFALDCAVAASMATCVSSLVLSWVRRSVPLQRSATSVSSSETNSRSASEPDTLQFRDFLLRGFRSASNSRQGVLGELAQAQLQNVVRLGVGRVEGDLQLFAGLSGLIDSRMIWMTSSMSRIATSRPSTRCRRSVRLPRRNSVRRRTTFSGQCTRASGSRAGRGSAADRPLTRTLLIPKESSSGVCL